MSDELTLGQRIDKLYELRAQRLAGQKKVDELKVQEDIEKVKISDLLKANGMARSSGMVATASRTSKLVPVPTDWDSIFNWMSQTQSYDIVQRRLSTTAWLARHEDGILVPGTESNEVWDLSLTRASRI